MKWPQGRRRGIWPIFFSLLYLLFVGTAIAISFWGSVNYAALNNRGVVVEDSVLDLSTTDPHDYSLNYVLMEEAVEALWPNKDSETGKISYRDSVWKLKRTLNENGLDSLVEFQRGRFRVNKNTASCDAWDVIHGNSSVTSIVSYLPTYEWAMNNEAEIMVSGNYSRLRLAYLFYGYHKNRYRG